jgi:hypothetical protein
MIKYALLAVGVAGALSANASLTIDYSVAGVAPIEFGGAYAGDPQHDTVTVEAYTKSGLILPNNTPTIATINTLKSVIYYTSVQGQWTYNIDRAMTITAPSGGTKTLTQKLVADSWLTYNPSDSVWTLAAGSTTTFNFPGIGTLDVTPLAQGPFKYGNGTYSENLEAEFLFTPVPEPATVFAGALLLLPLGVSTYRILRQKRTV